jgi:hypothetical protein
MILSVGYTLPYNRSGVIFSLSLVQSFLGDEGDYRPLQTPPPKEGGTSGNHLMYLLVGGLAEKVVTFLLNISQTKKVLGLK